MFVRQREGLDLFAHLTFAGSIWQLSKKNNKKKPTLQDAEKQFNPLFTFFPHSGDTVKCFQVWCMLWVSMLWDNRRNWPHIVQSFLSLWRLWQTFINPVITLWRLSLKYMNTKPAHIYTHSSTPLTLWQFPPGSTLRTGTVTSSWHQQLENLLHTSGLLLVCRAQCWSEGKRSFFSSPEYGSKDWKSNSEDRWVLPLSQTPEQETCDAQRPQHGWLRVRRVDLTFCLIISFSKSEESFRVAFVLKGCRRLIFVEFSVRSFFSPHKLMPQVHSFESLMSCSEPSSYFCVHCKSCINQRAYYVHPSSPVSVRSGSC